MGPSQPASFPGSPRRGCPPGDEVSGPPPSPRAPSCAELSVTQHRRSGRGPHPAGPRLRPAPSRARGALPRLLLRRRCKRPRRGRSGCGRRPEGTGTGSGPALSPTSGLSLEARPAVRPPRLPDPSLARHRVNTHFGRRQASIRRPPGPGLPFGAGGGGEHVAGEAGAPSGPEGTPAAPLGDPRPISAPKNSGPLTGPGHSRAPWLTLKGSLKNKPKTQPTTM